MSPSIHEKSRDISVEEAQQKDVPTTINSGVLGATHEVITIDPAISGRIVRKYDLRLLTMFLLINLFSFIDRVNIGNARLLGLQKDLELAVGLRYNM